MDFLYKEIGSAKSNLTSPIHNWFKFTAGFSYKFVDEIIKYENLTRDSVIFDPFAGCGTTLVSAQKNGIKAVGNEAQSFMYDIIKAKLNWNVDEIIISKHLNNIINNVQKLKHISLGKTSIHPLIFTLYEIKNLTQLILIKEAIDSIGLICPHMLYQYLS
jgi:adenine-specific DNA methylase